MRRVLQNVPSVALLLAAAVLFHAGWQLREPASARADRSARQAFAESVQRGERPRVAATNLAGVLRQELEIQDRAAGDRARLASWLLATALLSAIGLGAGIAARGRRTRSDAVAA